MNERVFLRVCVCVRVCVYIYIQLLATALSDSCAFLCVSGQELERFFCKVFCFPSVWRDRCVWGAFGGTFVTFDVRLRPMRALKFEFVAKKSSKRRNKKKKRKKKPPRVRLFDRARARARTTREENIREKKEGEGRKRRN